MKITVHATPENTKTILDLMEEQGVTLPCNCHGAGICGGSQYSFPCGMIPHSDCTVDVMEPRTLTGISLDAGKNSDILPDSLLIDLGTTTIAMVFYHSTEKTVYHSEVFPNPQITYGTDVISRIKYDVECSDDHILKTLICSEIRQHYELVCSRDKNLCIKLCLIGGNTTMIHLLLGLSLEGMSAAPFTPHSVTANQLHTTFHGTEVIILPWLSAFIGGDILSGMLALDFDFRSDSCLLIDLGTNGELALLHNGTIYAAGTAAGPAFEGAGLSCGCPAVPGAISDITWHRFMPKLQTISNKLPVGICGSGAISILSELITHGYIDSSGCLTEQFPLTGLRICKTSSSQEILFTASDLRQMQLAVAAIAAGIDALCKRAGTFPENIDQIYLAGGLGYSINIKKASVTGLFSKLPLEHITPVGNSCLHGLASFANTHSCLAKRIEHIRHHYQEHILAEDTYFQKRFIDHMTYG